MNKEICSAIECRSIIQFYYDGGIRYVEPYCHGVSRANNEVLRAYQIKGFSRSGQPSGWKLFEISKIINLQQTGDSFLSNRIGYNPNDQDFIMIHCHV